MSPDLDAVLRARERIREHVAETPLVRSAPLSEELGCEVWLKCENLQLTGSFKVRGATNKVRSLAEDGPLPPIVAASTGNHGAAVAFAARSVGETATVFAPEGTSPAKLLLMRELGARIELFGRDGVEAELHARSEAEARGACYVSPYNDAAVIAGQGTLCLELLESEPRFDAVFCALGGGGLTAGIATVLRELAPETRLYASSPESSAVMIRSVAAGRILDLPSHPTLSDGTAGGVEEDAITFPLLQELVSDYVMVPETATRRAFARFLSSHDLRIEGAAAMALAACRMQARELQGATVCVVLCGGNVDDEVLARLRTDPQGT